MANGDWQGVGVGGASAFTDLADAPSSYTGHAGKVVVVATSESGLVFDQEESGNVELIGGGNGGTVFVTGGAGGGGAFLTGGASGGYAIVKAGAGGSGILQNADGSVLIEAGPSDMSVLTPALYLTGLPTSNPGVSGQVWNDAGTLKISAG